MNHIKVGAQLVDGVTYLTLGTVVLEALLP